SRVSINLTGTSSTMCSRLASATRSGSGDWARTRITSGPRLARTIFADSTPPADQPMAGAPHRRGERRALAVGVEEQHDERPRRRALRRGVHDVDMADDRVAPGLECEQRPQLARAVGAAGGVLGEQRCSSDLKLNPTFTRSPSMACSPWNTPGQPRFHPL